MIEQTPDASRTRRDRLIHEHVHDPYKTKHKLPEPAVCPVCKAIFKNGRWQWTEAWPLDAHQEICQACHRERDGYPAGTVTLSGAFVESHRGEILHLARHQEQAEKAEHPLHRIMKVEEHPGSIVISTTDIHLPKRIGEALHHACKGNLEVHYDKESYFARVKWSRND